MTQPVLTKYKQGDLPQDYVKKASSEEVIIKLHTESWKPCFFAVP